MVRAGDASCPARALADGPGPDAATPGEIGGRLALVRPRSAPASARASPVRAAPLAGSAAVPEHPLALVEPDDLAARFQAMEVRETLAQRERGLLGVEAAPEQHREERGRRARFGAGVEHHRQALVVVVQQRIDARVQAAKGQPVRGQHTTVSAGKARNVSSEAMKARSGSRLVSPNGDASAVPAPASSGATLTFGEMPGST